MSWTTPDLYDANEGLVQVSHGRWLRFGQRIRFSGRIRTVKVHEDNALVKNTLQTQGDGAVLVVDGGASLRSALIGDNLAGFALAHGWAGLVIHGAIRDSEVIDTLDLGVRCLGTTPRRSAKNGFGVLDEAVEFSGIRFVPGHFVYVDADGILASESDLLVS